MPQQRPIVEVLQEFVEATADAEVPDQPVIVCGPSYHIRDYDVDKDSLGVGIYGSRVSQSDDSTGTAVDQPIANTTALTIDGVPDGPEGAYQLDNASLRGWLDDALIEVVAQGSPDGNVVNAGENKFASDDPAELQGLSGSPTSYADIGVRPGDRLIVTDTDTDFTIERTIMAVGGLSDHEPSSNLGNFELLVRTDFPDGDSETGLQGLTQMSLSTNLSYRIEKSVSDTIFYEDQSPSSYLEVAGPEDDTIEIFGGIQLTTETADGTEVTGYVNYAKPYLDYRALRQDLARTQTMLQGNVESEVGRLDERNPLATGIQMAFRNSGAVINSEAIRVRYYGMPADNLNGQNDLATAVSDLVNHLSTKEDVYNIVLLDDEQANLVTLTNHANNFSNPERARYRAVLGGGIELPDFNVLNTDKTGAVDSVSGDPLNILVDTTTTAEENFEEQGVQEGDNLAIAQTRDSNENDNDAINNGDPYKIQEVLPNDDLVRLEEPSDGVFSSTSDPESFYVYRGGEEVVDEFEVNIDNGAQADQLTNATGGTTDYAGYLIELVDPDAANSGQSTLNNDTYLIIEDNTGSNQSYSVGSQVSFASGETGVQVRVRRPVFSRVSRQVVFRQPFRTLDDSEGSFIANDVVAGDLVEVPLPPVSAGTDFSGDTYLAEIETVLSENRVRFIEGTDIPTEDSDTAQTDVGYRTVRILGTQGQADELVSITESIQERRLILTWPDEVKLTGIQNERTGRQNWVPGYYVAAAIGGMSASLPPHQGLTNVGVNGIDDLRHSDDYFDYDQISQISNNGWFVLTQETDDALPVIEHQVTTDTSTLEDAEWSYVRTVDYVSSVYKSVLEQFIGRYNVYAGVLSLLASSIEGTTEELKNDSLPRIGAPLIDADITTLEEVVPDENSDAPTDEVRLVLDAQFPAPLNRIQLVIKA